MVIDLEKCEIIEDDIIQKCSCFSREHTVCTGSLISIIKFNDRLVLSGVSEACLVSDNLKK